MTQVSKVLLARRDTAGRLMTPLRGVVGLDMSVGQLRAGLGKAHSEADPIIVVVDVAGRFAGAAPLGDVLMASDDTMLTRLIEPAWPRIGVDDHQEHAAELATHHQRPALVVTDVNCRPVGIIAAERLLAVLAREHREDTHRLVGILKERDSARHALADPPLERARQRLPWLIVGLVLSTAGTALMASFEAALSAQVKLAFFIPALVYLADAIGTQSEAIVVRGLALMQRPLTSALLGEIVTGALIGTVLAALAFLGLLAVFGSLRLAGGVAISLLIASTLASALGLLLPWGLARAGADPALGSGPVATIIQDVLTILVYLVVMTRLLPAS